MKFTLTKPILVEGNEVRELDIREDVTAGDLEVMDGAKGQIAQSRLLIAHLANVPPSALRSMRAADFQALNAMVQPFLEHGQSTGGTSAAT